MPDATVLYTKKDRIAYIILNRPEAENIINSRIEVTGPDGQITSIVANGLFSGSVSASGPIGTLESLTGDIIASITTTTDRGNLTLIRAARDLDITTDISGNISQIVAGRQVGSKDRQGVVRVRGDLASAIIQLCHSLAIAAAPQTRLRMASRISLPPSRPSRTVVSPR